MQHQTNPSEAENGPNKYPSLPPVQDPQSQHPPQQNYPPVQYPQYNPNVKGQPGYVPPPQYGNVQTGPMADEYSENVRLTNELNKLDLGWRSLDCYVTWNCIMAFIMVKLTILFWWKYKSMLADYEFYAFVAFAIWTCVQTYFASESIKQKSLIRATVACWMMTITLIIASVNFGFAINYQRNANGEPIFVIILGIHLVMHIVVSMGGAFKVRKMLIERAKIQMKMIKSSFAPNQA